MKRFSSMPCRCMSRGGWQPSCVPLRRALHTPLGGFDQPPPASLGKSQAKGSISSVNLRLRRHRIQQQRRHRKKLATPAATRKDERGTGGPTLSEVKVELLHLVKRNDMYSGKTPAASAAYHRPVDLPDEAFRAFADRTPAPAEDTHDDAGDVTPPPSLHSSRLLSEEQEALRQAPVFDLAPAPHYNQGAGEDGADWVDQAEAMERNFTVTPGSTVFGSDLDRLERDIMREFHQKGEGLPKPDRVFSELGGTRQGQRMQWEPSSSFDHLRTSDFVANVASEGVLGSGANRNLSPYHMYAEAYQLQQEEARRGLPGEKGIGQGINLAKGEMPEEAMEAAEENPHFPVECCGDGPAPGASSASPAEEHDAELGLRYMASKQVVIDARRDYHAVLDTAASSSPPAALPGKSEAEDLNRLIYDAYRQRPSDNRLMEHRGATYWSDVEKRQEVDLRSMYRKEAFEKEVLEEGAMDTSEVEYSTNKIRKETFLYFQAHPINEMIQEPFVRIREFMPPGEEGSLVVFNPHVSLEDGAGDGGDAVELQDVRRILHADVDVPVQEARRMAQELGLDLIRVGSFYSEKSDRRVIALCRIGDHREHLRDIIKFKMQKLGVQPPPTKACIEVPFKGGTHPHAIRFKSVGIAKHLLHRHAIRINLTKFGTPREGFPVFQSILDEIKKQCLQLKAYHKAGEIQSNYEEIYCYLYPSTGRSPKTTVTHPTPTQVERARDERILENEKEIYFDDLHDKVTQKQRLEYMLKMDKGTAWAEKDAGMSLQRQRALKVMLGYLPKGNNEMYAARGDVNIPAPFRSSHPTSAERWTHPTETNLEQASRGAAALGKRASMPISEMHDRDETPENSTQLDRFYYTAQGPALEIGEFKEALGLKDNRRKRPPFAGGFATLQTGKGTGAGTSGGGDDRLGAAIK